MKDKQLKQLKAQYSTILTWGHTPQPSPEKGIIEALVMGEKLTLKKPEQIIKECRLRVARETYHRDNIPIRDLFVSTRSFDTEMAAWQTKERIRKAKVAKFTKQANRLIAKAEIDETMTVEQAMEALFNLAEQAGLSN